MNSSKFDLSERLEDFVAKIILLFDKKPLSFAGATRIIAKLEYSDKSKTDN